MTDRGPERHDEETLQEALVRTRDALERAGAKAGGGGTELREQLARARQQIEKFRAFVNSRKRSSRAGDWDENAVSEEDALRERMAIAGLEESLEQIRANANNVRPEVGQIGADRIGRDLMTWLRLFLTGAVEYLSVLRAVIEVASRDESEKQRLSDETWRFEQEARDLYRAEQTRSTGEIVAANAASEDLAEYFEAYSNRQSSIADWLRGGALFSVLALAGIAVAFFFPSYGNTPSVALSLQHLLVALPFAAMSAYLGRESSRHRANATWAKELDIQLRTLAPFTKPLSYDQSLSVRTAFGQRVFGARSADQSGDETTQETSSLHNLLEALRDLVAALSGNRSGRSAGGS